MKYGLAFLISSLVVNAFARLNIQPEGPSAVQEFEAFGGKGPKLPHNVKPHAKFLNNRRDLSEHCRKDVHVIQASGDLYTLGLQCKNISGSVTFSNYEDSVIDFGDIESIGGSVIIEDSSSVVKIQGRNLRRVGGVLLIKNLTSLVSIELPLLRYVKSLEWKVVPVLTNAKLDDQIEGLTSITISDSSLATINGFQKVDEVTIFDINNNRYLERINTNLKKVTKELRVHANAKELEIELPQLKYAKNITVRDTSSIELPKLESVDNSLEFIENQAPNLLLPNLKSIGGTLSIMENKQLSTLDFGNVTDINGGLVIANNTNLEKIDFLQKLKQIGGAIYFEGKFRDTEFPQLRLVKGSALIKSNSLELDCNKWITPLHGRAIIRGGKLLCVSGRKHRIQNISEDGEVLDESETGSNEEKGKSKGKSKDNGKNKNKSGTKLSNSGGSLFDNLNMVWIFIITSTLCVLHVFHLG